jgi:outer membrane protein OmpA-like peptidoglycan-associated protein
MRDGMRPALWGGMQKLSLFMVSLLPVAAIACSSGKAAGPDMSPETHRAGPTAATETDRAGPTAALETERAGPNASPETDRAGPSAKLHRTPTGPTVGAFGPSNINYSSDTPKTTSLVRLDARLASECGLGNREVYFAHDSATLTPDAEQKMKKLADCLDTGKLANMKIAVIGFADPSGTEQYNEELGKERAQGVVQALSDRGVKEGRLAAISGGEVGDETDASGWPRARHVAIIPYEVASN